MIASNSRKKMVNKALLSVGAVLLFVVFASGVLVGMLLGGPAADATGTGTGSPVATATPDGANSQSASTPGTTPDQDGESADERDPIPPRQFTEADIAAAIVRNINDARAEDGLPRFSSSDNTADRVEAMAQAHTQAMADAGRVNHTIDGVTSEQRYRDNDLYQRCGPNVDGTYVETPDGNDLEVVGETVAGQPYTADGSQQFNENDTAVATALTDAWLSNQTLRERLLVDADDVYIGVGVVVNNRGTVYATVNIC